MAGGVGAVEYDDHIWVRRTVPKTVPAVKLLCVSDTHDQHMFMPKALPPADILIHAGDFTCRGSKDELQNFRAWTDDLLAAGVVKEIVFIAGNHEITLELKARNPAVLENQRALKRAIAERPNVHYMEDSACEACGVRFYGVPWCTRFGRDWAFQLKDTPEELGERYGLIPEDVHVLVTHQPPFGQGDYNGCDARTGSRMLLERILAAPPLVHVFGHIHTGHGLSSREVADVHTLFVNAAVCDEDYKPVQKPILIEMVHADAMDVGAAGGALETEH
jgi:Icc-related predicted phosphoesterase